MGVLDCRQRLEQEVRYCIKASQDPGNPQDSNVLPTVRYNESCNHVVTKGVRLSALCAVCAVLAQASGRECGS